MKKRRKMVKEIRIKSVVILRCSGKGRKTRRAKERKMKQHTAILLRHKREMKKKKRTGKK